MLVRITWALVVVALGTLIGGFFTPESNVLLFVAIGLALGVIVLVLVSWARRAKEPGGFGFEDRVVAADADAGDDEELFAALERDEEFAVGGRRAARRPRPRPGRKTRTARPEGKPKAKPKAKSKSKAKSKAKAKSTRKTTTRAPSSESKAKPARKAKPKAKPKAKGSPATRRKAPPPPSPEPEPE